MGEPNPRQEVFDTYWYFAAERQHIFYRRLSGEDGPWTDDPILRKHKFCNAFRAADRVSQYLIRDVIYGDGLSQSVEDVIFRTLLFRLFNRCETWDMFFNVLGEPRAAAFERDRPRLSTAIADAMAAGDSVFGAAYMIAPTGKPLGYPVKHDGYLEVAARMLAERVPERVAAAPSLRDAYDIMRTCSMVGPFLAYQLATDLNYGPVIDFDEDDFTKAGPGAKRGIAKCFEDRGGLTDEEIIHWMVDNQECELQRLGIDPQSVWLWGRRLKAIDCQNLFCETDKYCRVGFPEIKSNRAKIKQVFSPSNRPQPIGYVCPPKWGISDTGSPPTTIPPKGTILSPAPGAQLSTINQQGHHAP